MSRVTNKLKNLTGPEKLMIFPILMIIFLSCMAVGMLTNEDAVANETSLAHNETVEASTEMMTAEETTEITEEESEVIETTEDVETSMEETVTEESEYYVEPTTVDYITIEYPTYPDATSVTVSEVVAGDDNAQPTETVDSFAPYYYIICDGVKYTMSHELQTYIYNLCLKYDIEWFYPYFMAQLFHESRWQEGLVTERGDYGIAQINISMHPHLTDALGITDYANSYNSVTAGLYLMNNYLSRGYTVRQAMTAYRWGEGKANDPDPENYYDTVCSYTQCLFREN